MSNASKLRLLVTKDCPKSCEGCCNKQWDLDALPIETDFSGYDEIYLTGGDPLFRFWETERAIKAIRKQAPYVPIYLYTSYLRDHLAIYSVVPSLAGMTITLHNEQDAHDMVECLHYFSGWEQIRSYRLHIFKDVYFPREILPAAWQVREGIEWIENCPLPEGEVFKRFR
jgi:hypothetical protein